jgi:hypothetical protein
MPDHLLRIEGRFNAFRAKALTAGSQEEVYVLTVQKKLRIVYEAISRHHVRDKTPRHHHCTSRRAQDIARRNLMPACRQARNVPSQRGDFRLQPGSRYHPAIRPARVEYRDRVEPYPVIVVNRMSHQQSWKLFSNQRVRIERDDQITCSYLNARVHAAAEAHILVEPNNVIDFNSSRSKISIQQCVLIWLGTVVDQDDLYVRPLRRSLDRLEALQS